MFRLTLLFLLPLQATAAPVDATSCSDTWETVFELDHGAVRSCEVGEVSDSVVQEWVAVDQAFDEDAQAGLAQCESVDVVQQSGKRGSMCTHYAQAQLCRSALNPHRVVIERGEGETVLCPGE